jgi:hypothetical protein
MNEEVARDLRRVFGYVPEESDGEKWTVFQDQTLIVIHPARQPRLYRRGATGPDDYSTIDPLPF